MICHDVYELQKSCAFPNKMNVEFNVLGSLVVYRIV
jgi:hypothetical protein